MELEYNLMESEYNHTEPEYRHTEQEYNNTEPVYNHMELTYNHAEVHWRNQNLDKLSLSYLTWIPKTFQNIFGINETMYCRSITRLWDMFWKHLTLLLYI